MSDIIAILGDLVHRPWELPKGKWQYYQEWNDVIFLHWEVPFHELRKLVPQQLNLDDFNSVYYISLVAFTMQKIRPRNLPSLKPISDFHEINVRTYIDNNGKKGVYFLNIEAEKWLSAFIAKKLSGLPYEKATIHRAHESYTSINIEKNFRLEINYRLNGPLINKSELDKWLTERYCLYLIQKNKTFRYDIHHREWSISPIELKHLNLTYQLGKLDLSSERIVKAHYSEGVKVVSWKKEML